MKIQAVSRYTTTESSCSVVIVNSQANSVDYTATPDCSLILSICQHFVLSTWISSWETVGNINFKLHTNVMDGHSYQDRLSAYLDLWLMQVWTQVIIRPYPFAWRCVLLNFLWMYIFCVHFCFDSHEFVRGSLLFTSSGTRYYHGFNISLFGTPDKSYVICTNNVTTEDEAVSLGFTFLSCNCSIFW